MSSFLLSLPAVFGNALGFMFFDATLSYPGALVTDGAGGFTTTPATQACKALIEEYDEYTRAKNNIPAAMRKIIILGNSLGSVVPQGDYTIQVHDPENKVWTIHEVERDPAGATYNCRSS